MTRYIYVPDYRYTPSLTKMEVVKETPKTFKIGKRIAILGFSRWARIINKENDGYYETAEEAIRYLIERGCVIMENAEKTLQQAAERNEMLEELLVKLEQTENKESDNG